MQQLVLELEAGSQNSLPFEVSQDDFARLLSNAVTQRTNLSQAHGMNILHGDKTWPKKIIVCKQLVHNFMYGNSTFKTSFPSAARLLMH